MANPLKPNAPVRITKPGPYYQAEGVFLRTASVEYQGAFVEFKTKDGRTRLDLIPLCYIEPMDGPG